jgi:hypothetical protein
MQTFCDLAIKSDEFQPSLFIIHRNFNLFLHISIVCITLALIRPANTDAQVTSPDATRKEQMSGLQETACNSCLQVLLKLKDNDPHIWKTCDFCLKLLKLEPDHPIVIKTIKQIKKRLLYKRINALKKLFRYEKEPDQNKPSELSINVETDRILNNIITILEYLKKLNEMFDLGSPKETMQLGVNIEKYKKLLNSNKTK